MSFAKNLREVTLTEEIINGTTTTTYVGKARIPSGIQLSDYEALAKWQVCKYVDVITGTSPNTTTNGKQYFPVNTDGVITKDYLFSWSNRATLTYK